VGKNVLRTKDLARVAPSPKEDIGVTTGSRTAEEDTATLGGLFGDREGYLPRKKYNVTAMNWQLVPR